MRKKFDLDDYKLSGYEGLAIAIVLQAITDWNYLCDGHNKSELRNFKELERFFKCDCGKSLMLDDITTETIFSQLQTERNNADFQYKRSKK